MAEKSGYKAYFPDDDQGPEDAVDVMCWSWEARFFTAEDAAKKACEYDYSDRDGWERDMSGGETCEFPIIIIDSQGDEHRYLGKHEATIEHRVRADDGDEDRDGLQAGEGAGRPDPAGAGQEGADGQAGCLDPAEG